MEERKMVKISVDIESGATRFRVKAQARSIRQALAMVGDRYPHSKVSVAFPIEPEAFFVTGPTSPAGVVGSEHAPLEAA
jgi:hypothetical protein